MRLLLLLLAACTSPLATPEPTRRPNIVVLFADDAGYADFGFQPDARADLAALTPRIDSIAATGARFTNAYMSGSVCSPSRAGLMTGRYQSRFGHGNNLPPGFQSGVPLFETFVARRLADLGYATGLVGKWHLGYPPEYHPNRRGFDWFYGCLQGSRSYHPLDDPSPQRVLQENGEPTPESGYVTDRLGDAACRFVAQHADEPFFLFVSFTAPHGPLQPRAGDGERLAHIAEKRRRNYAGLVVALDDNVGKILDALEEAELADDTLVIFTNDNGGQTQTGAVNAPLRGRKGMLYEGGVRVPMAMRWPGCIPSGTVVDDPVIALDLLPTFVSLAGGEPHADWELDGVDLSARLTGATPGLPERSLYWRQHGELGPIALRAGRWKVVHDRKVDGRSPELYDLGRDVAEEHDLAEQEPEVLARLLARLAAWEADLEPPRWGANAKK